jgi:hypothetical protein
MKAKYCIGILSAIMLAGMSVRAQDYDDVYLDNDYSNNYSNSNPRIVVNNYYDDYDFYYASRINRFHRSYAVFDYYSPFYTDAYWYTYTPFTWGLSIYRGGLGFSIGYNFGYPVYYGYPYYYDWDWYDPYYYSYNYRGYDPYYYNSWYWGYYPYYRYTYWCTPAAYDFGYRGSWGYRNHWWGWNSNRNRFYSWNDYRPYRYSNNGNYNNNHPSRPSTLANGIYGSRRNSSDAVNRQGNGYSTSRRGASERPSTSVIHNDNHGGRSALPGQSVNRRSSAQTLTTRNTGLPVNRRNSGQQSARGVIQPATVRNNSQPVSRSQNRSFYAPARPSYSAVGQPSSGRRSSVSAMSHSQNRSFSASSRSYSGSQRGSSMSAGHSSHQSASRSSSSSHSSGSSHSGRR